MIEIFSPTPMDFPQPQKNFISTIVVVGVLFIGSLLYLLFFRDNWEANNKDMLWRLTGEADALVKAGKFDEAKEKYNDLWQLLGQRKISDFALDAQIQFERSESATVDFHCCR